MLGLGARVAALTLLLITRNEPHHIKFELLKPYEINLYNYIIVHIEHEMYMYNKYNNILSNTNIFRFSIERVKRIAKCIYIYTHTSKIVLLHFRLYI